MWKCIEYVEVDRNLNQINNWANKYIKLYICMTYMACTCIVTHLLQVTHSILSCNHQINPQDHPMLVKVLQAVG